MANRPEQSSPIASVVVDHLASAIQTGTKVTGLGLRCGLDVARWGVSCGFAAGYHLIGALETVAGVSESLLQHVPDLTSVDREKDAQGDRRGRSTPPGIVSASSRRDLGVVDGLRLLSTVLRSGLTVAEFATATGLNASEFWIGLGLSSTRAAASSVAHLFGTSPTARAVREFAQLVQREMAREMATDQTPMSPEMAATHAPLTLAAQGWIHMLRGVVAVSALQSSTLDVWRDKVRDAGALTPVSAVWDARLRTKARRYMRFSAAVFGPLAHAHMTGQLTIQTAMSWLFPDVQKETRSPDTPASLPSAAWLCPALGLDPADVLYEQEGGLPESGNFYHPALMVFVDHSTRAVVVALRGTMSFHDLMVDLSCEAIVYHPLGTDATMPRPSYDPTTYPYAVHGGIYRAAKQLLVRQGPGSFYDVVEKARAKHSSYTLVFTGHSLGGGLATMLALAWPGVCIDLPDVQSQTDLPAPSQPAIPMEVWAYGAPCVVSAPLGACLQGWVHSVVLEADVVARLSFASVRRLAFGVVNLKLMFPEIERDVVRRTFGMGPLSDPDLHVPSPARAADGSDPPSPVRAAWDDRVDRARSELWNASVRFAAASTRKAPDDPGNIILVPGGSIYWFTRWNDQLEQHLFPYSGAPRASSDESLNGSDSPAPPNAQTSPHRPMKTQTPSDNASEWRVMHVRDPALLLSEMQLTGSCLMDHMPQAYVTLLDEVTQ